jgi:hypothetical protein
MQFLPLLGNGIATNLKRLSSNFAVSLAGEWELPRVDLQPFEMLDAPNLQTLELSVRLCESRRENQLQEELEETLSRIGKALVGGNAKIHVMDETFFRTVFNFTRLRSSDSSI